MFFLIYGTDCFRIRQKYNKLKKEFIFKRDKSGLNVIELNGTNIDFDSFKSEVMSLPFLAEKKMIVIKDFFTSHPVGKNKKTHKQYADFLLNKINNIDNIVGFVQDLNPEKYPKGSKLSGSLFNFFKQQNYIWQLDLLPPYKTKQWIEHFIKENNINIATESINELTIRCGSDLYKIKNELSKLVAFASGRQITRQDVADNVKSNIEDKIFDLIDAIGQKNKKLALKLLRDQLFSGCHELRILAMIIRQYKIMLMIKSNLNAKQAGIHPFVYQKASQQARLYSNAELILIYNNLINIEHNTKTGKNKAVILLDIFISKNSQ